MSEVVDQLAKNLAELSDAYGRRPLLGRQLLGAAWSPGNFWMGSRCSVEDGFWSVTYLIVEKDFGAVIGFGKTKEKALSQARWAISCAGTAGVLVEKVAAELAVITARLNAEFDEMMGEFREELKSRKTPQLRVDVFEKSSGACHYCSTTLDLRGDWHVEHMVPLVRGGSDHISNLVASCPPCNLKKGTKTAEEFMALVTHL
jgi:hypothetical protein